MSMQNDDLNMFLEDGKKSKNDDLQLDESSDFVIEEEREEAEKIKTTVNSKNSSSVVTIDLNKDKFAAFMSILQMMKYSCQDVFIRGGKISQINSKRSMFFHIDLTPIFGNADLVIGGIASKFEILSMFRKQGVDVCLDILDTVYVFRDALSKIYNKKPIEAFLENTAMSEDTVREKLKVKYDKRIFQYSWQKRVLDRIMIYAKSLATPVIRVEFMGSTILCKAQSLDSAATTQVDVVTLEDEVDDSTIKDLVAPFPAMSFINFIQAGIVEIESALYHRDDPNSPSCVLELKGELPVAGLDEPINICVRTAAFFSPLNQDSEGNII